MRTDDLISTLVADERSPPPGWVRSIGLATGIGTLVTALVFLGIVGFRPDMADAFTTWRFDLKLGLIVFALVLALRDAARLRNPTASNFASRESLLLPLAILCAVAIEFWLTPQEDWTARLFGTNWLVCLIAIPVLSLAPLAAGLYAMRSGAPASAATAGAAIGRLAAAMAALVYALHCIDDSPLFVAAWYSISTLGVIAAGAFAGRYLLRW